jgi:hypothetical protein
VIETWVFPTAPRVDAQPYIERMNQPSPYELDAWASIQQFKGRQLSARMAQVGQLMSDAANTASDRAVGALEGRPRAQATLEKGKTAATSGGKAVASGVRAARGALPGWVGTVGGAARQTTGKVSRAGLSPKRVVARHQKLGHIVSNLHDVRTLDLEQIDAAKGRAASWLYPAGAALSGAGAGLVISGGQFTTVASAGASAAPTVAAVSGAFVGDAAAVLALGSRAVGRTALMYGYDPESPAEKLFVMSVVNAGSAATAGAKTAAFKDVSKLTQALVRGKTWKVLNETVVAKVANQFAKAFSVRLTQQGLGKLVPAAGIGIGGALNWATLEGIVDTADIAYRRRLLLEKYPALADVDMFGEQMDGSDMPSNVDVEISVIKEFTDAGGELD